MWSGKQFQVFVVYKEFSTISDFQNIAERTKEIEKVHNSVIAENLIYFYFRFKI